MHKTLFDTVWVYTSLRPSTRLGCGTRCNPHECHDYWVFLSRSYCHEVGTAWNSSEDVTDAVPLLPVDPRTQRPNMTEWNSTHVYYNMTFVHANFTNHTLPGSDFGYLPRSRVEGEFSYLYPASVNITQ